MFTTHAAWHTTNAPAVTVTDPGWGYGSDPWGAMQDGQAQDQLRRFLDEHGAVLRDKSDSVLYLEAKPTTPGSAVGLPVVTDAAGAEYDESVTELSARQPYTVGHNAVLVFGKDADGRTLSKYAAAATSPIPYNATLTVDARDRAATQADCDRIATQELAKLVNGAKELTATNPGYGWYDLWSGDYVAVTSATLGLNEALYQIVNMDLDFEVDQKRTVVALTLREAV